MYGLPTNDDRAESTARPLAVFARSQGLMDEDCATQLSDLICNLMHRCEAEDLDAFAIVERATGLFASECVAENDLGPDQFAKITIDGLEPRVAIQAGQALYAKALAAAGLDN